MQIFEIKTPRQELNVPNFVNNKKAPTQVPKNDYVRTPKKDTLEIHSHKTRKNDAGRPLANRPVAIHTGTAILALISGIGIGANSKNIAPTQPENYSYIQEAIENTQDPLEKEALILKQEKQNEIATSYRDGDFVYYIINPSDEESEPNSISVTKFKDLFDIEDGVLKKYNHLDRCYTDTAPDPDGHRGIYTYDLHMFEEGDVIKVPINAIETDDIDLKGYYPIIGDYVILDQE